MATGIKNLLLGGVLNKDKTQTLKYEKRNSDVYLEFNLFHFNNFRTIYIGTRKMRAKLTLSSSPSLGNGAGTSERSQLLTEKADFDNVEGGTPLCAKVCSPTFSLLPPHKCSLREAQIHRQQIQSLRLEVVASIEADSWENSRKFPT